ncbi:MAG: hypothetical protein QHH28_04820 [Ignavibacteria bacterium]|nr:hypothetical protein [Ignavibacteria bacterium]
MKNKTNKFITDLKSFNRSFLIYQGNLKNFFEYKTLYNSNRIKIEYTHLTKRVKPLIYENDKNIIFINGYTSFDNNQNYLNINNIVGNFNIVNVDKSKDEVTIVKDYTNSFDLFIYEDNMRIIISNNPLLILDNHKSLEVDFEAVVQYLTQYYGLFYNNYFFTNIKKIKPASFLKLNSLGLTQLDLFDFNYDVFDGDPIEIFEKIILNNFNRNLIYGVDITGGYDTRLINACLLKNNIKYKMIVHGEESPEIEISKKIAEFFNNEIYQIKISNKINDVIKNWKFYFSISGGYNNFFELLKEGIRSNLRMFVCDTKVSGGLGEPLRDKWYLDKYGRNSLNYLKVWDLLIKKLFDHVDFYDFVNKDLISVLNNYQNRLFNSFQDFVKNYSELDDTSKFVIFKYNYYMTRGWLGNLNNLHNNFVEMIAPYMDNYFYTTLLNVDSNFRNRARGMTKMILEFEPKFKYINFIDGQKCREMDLFNKAYFLRNKILNKIKKELFGYNQVSDYDHLYWLINLIKNEEFRDIIFSKNKNFNSIISEFEFNKLLEKFKDGKLSYTQKHFVYKLITLKLNFYLNEV